MPRLLTRAEIRSVDQLAIDEFGMSGVVLMENAGRGVAEVFHRRAPSASVAICCGRGNNGGDGFVIARHLENLGHRVAMFLFGDPHELTPDATVNYQIAETAELPIRIRCDEQLDDPTLRDEIAGCDWIIDCLLGTGPTDTLREPWPQVIERLNGVGHPILACDLPSGLHPDDGVPLGAVIRATVTATFVAEKAGFAKESARGVLGEIETIDIGIPRTLRERFS